MLAPGNPPTTQGLSDAIVAVLQDPDTYARYSDGAECLAKEFSLERHLRLLLEVFEGVVQ